ncbi:TlpA disulfide reductase family protein [Telluribacter sp. SYSU D00476]|uniref:TlpA family protein disulfide reductase n=1 Tax=Telluribacter sp. SYSU D00476 TaxID=2811430 RepID=UPI001FF4D4E2|nr:TlpA disulfide reductase family protein [Telluribacter sp. SYSU D00476]
MRSKYVKYTLILVLLLFAALAIYYSVSEPEPTEYVTPADESSALPVPYGSVYLPLTTLEGSPVTMDSTKLVFINVWATWCGPCNMEMPSIQALYDRYKSNSKIAFYIISDEAPNTVVPFIKRKGYELPFYQYEGIYPPELNGDAIPRTYILRNGQVLAAEIGANRWDDPKVIDFIEQQLRTL